MDGVNQIREGKIVIVAVVKEEEEEVADGLVATSCLPTHPRNYCFESDLQQTTEQIAGE